MKKQTLAGRHQNEAFTPGPWWSLSRTFWRIHWMLLDSRDLWLQVVRYLPTSKLRVLAYRVFRMKIDRGARIEGGCIVLGGPQRISIGEGSVINWGVTLDGRFPLTIGSNASISIHTVILTLQHDINAPDFPLEGAPVTIGDRAFVGARALILPGVNIGEGAVVAAGAVVTKDVDPFSIVAGVPAARIGTRSRDLTYRLADARP